MFVLGSDITIGNGESQLHFSGVHDVQIKKSIHTFIDTATITLPTVAIFYSKINRSNPQKVITSDKFKDGDPIIIKLGYNGELNEEFRGFIKRRNLNTPLEIECEGYSYQLKRNNVNGTWKSISIKDLLKHAIIDTDIKLNVAVDIQLSNVTISNQTGAAVIDYIYKATDYCVSIFFIEPDILWAGLVYTKYKTGQDIFNGSQVAYKLGYNVVKDNSLKEITEEDNPVQVEFGKKLASGERVSGSAEILKNISKKYKKLLNNVSSPASLKLLAQEKQDRYNYQGYEGKINAFLSPYASPGDKAYIFNTQYTERAGTYLIESVNITYGISGAKRIIEIGPKIGD